MRSDFLKDNSTDAASGARASESGEAHGPNSPMRRGSRWRAVLGALVVLPALAAVGIALAASPQVAEPAITSGPANPTNQTSASFTYTDSQAGVTLRCQLDSLGYTPCPAAGITYPGPLVAGNHAFRVQATSGTKVSTIAAYTWTIDTTPATMTQAFPANGGLYSSEKWSEGCSPAGICGKAKDAHAVQAVAVSIQAPSGKWWGGSSFDKATETFNGATLEAPGADTTGWTYPLAIPADGSYTVHVRATDGAGNTNTAATQLAGTFATDRTAPPRPTISSGPEEETGQTSATFVFGDSEEGATLLCSRDGAAYAACASPKTYSVVQGEHTVSIEARDHAGNVSAATSYSWIVVKGFTISGSLIGALAPGITRPLQLTISNPNNKALLLTSLHVSVETASTKAGCDGPTNLQITQSDASEAHPLSVPARGHVVLPAGSVTAPQVLMKDLATNQDACKGASFTFDYTGNGHS